MQRIWSILEIVLERFKLGEIGDVQTIRRELICSDYELDESVRSAIQMHKFIREIKICNQKFLYHSDLAGCTG